MGNQPFLWGVWNFVGFSLGLYEHFYGDSMGLIITGWCFGTWLLFFHIQLG
jgi:hypothetical protein